MQSIAAIDFGTSNSTIGIMRGGKPTLLTPEPHKQAVPTALFFPQRGQPLHGNAAIQAYLDEEPGRFMRGLKGVLGTQLFNESTQIAGQTVTFKEIIATYISWLTAKAEAELGAPLTHLMLGRPVHFLTSQPEADAIAEAQLREVVTEIGIPNLAFMQEPLAAAYHYEHTLHHEELALIIDIGGGTADFSLLRLGPKLADKSDRTADILATHGLRLGGAMIDQAFALAEVMPTFGYGSPIESPMSSNADGKILTVPAGYFTQLTTWHRIHRMYEKSTLQEVRTILAQEATEPAKVERLLALLEERGGHRLMLDLEACKITLSNEAHTLLNLHWIERNLALPLTQPALAAAINPWLTTLTESIHHTLHLAQTKPEALTTAPKTVFVTGGPSAMPLVQSAIRTALPHANIILGDQLTSVGTGLILAAHRHFN